MSYNRPWHTAQVLNALREHSVQNLFIFSDGPKTENDKQAVLATRRLFDKVNWTKPEIIYRETNYGLAKSILSAVDYVFEKYDRLILLEDDCVPGNYYFEFIEKCLSKYENNERIFGINGYTVPIPDGLLRDYPFDIYFYPRIGSWGWATWKRAWAYYDTDLSKLYNQVIADNIDITQGGTDIPDNVRKLLNGQLRDVWTLNWVLAVYLNKGYYIYPTTSQIRNIGLDGTGIHCDVSEKFNNSCADKKIITLPDDVIVNQDLIDNYNSFFAKPEGKIETAHNYNIRRHNEPNINSVERAWSVPKKRGRLSIVHMNTEDTPGGASKVAWRLAEVQRSAGHNSTMLVGHKNSESEYSFSFPLEVNASVKAQCQQKGLLYHEFQGSHKLVNNPLIQSADILHLHNLHGGYFNPFSLSSLSNLKPTIWTLHDMQAITGHCAHSFDCRRWEHGCGQCPDLSIYPKIQVDETARLWKDKKQIYDNSRLWIVTPSQWLKNKVERSILGRHPIELIYNGIDTKIFRPCRKEAVRNKLHLPQNGFILAFSAQGGMNSMWRDGECLAETINYFSTKGEPVLFLNIGAEVNSFQGKNTINVPCINDEEKLALVYSAVDLFLFPSLADNCPLAVIESMACGLPVVAYSTGGIPEIVKNGQTGLLVERRNRLEFIKAVEHLIFGQALRETYGRAGRARVENMFSLDLMAARYSTSCEQSLETSRRENYTSPRNRIAIRINGTEQVCSHNQPASAFSMGCNLPAGVNISIVVATQNRAQLLDNMLTSLKGAADGISYEVIVVEGGSSDSTLQVLQKHSVTKVYIESESLGAGKHSWPQLYNFGFSKARGKWAMYASDDIVFDKGCITKAVDILRKQKSPSVAGGVFFYKEVIPDSPGWERLGICFALGHKLLMNFGLFRLDVFRELGGLDEAYGFYSADIDFSFKIYKGGRQLIPLPDCSLTHDNVQDASRQKNTAAAKKDHQYLLKKWAGFVPSELAPPNRLFWEPSYAKAFLMPQELDNINTGIEHFWHAIACFQLGRFEEALEQFSQTLNASCKHWTVFWLAAESSYRSGLHKQAEEMAFVVLRMNPDCAEIRPLLARLKEDGGQPVVRTGRNARQGPAILTKSNFVIEVKYGGIGDHLFYSHLPRIAKQSGGYDRVYISNHSVYRSEEYKKLVWELNPYVDGFCDGNGEYPLFDSVEEGMNILDKIMLLRGLDDGRRFHEPELYFKCQPRPDLSEAVVYDPNFVSYVGDVSSQEIESFLQNNRVRVTHQMKLRDKNCPIGNYKTVLEATKLEDFCRIVVSCKQLLCLSSGTATIAAALGKPAIVFYGDGQKKMFHHSRLHKYVDCSTKTISAKPRVLDASRETKAKPKKVYCVLFDSMPLLEEVVSVAGSKGAEILRQVNGCFTTTSCVEMLTGKLPSDLEDNGIGYELCLKYRDNGMHWPWEGELIVSKFLDKGCQVSLHNGEWFSGVMCTNPAFTRTTSFPGGPEIEQQKTWADEAIVKMMLGDGPKTDEFYRDEIRHIHRMQSEKLERNTFYFVKYDQFHAAMVRSSRKEIATERLVELMKQWDFKEPDAIFWFFSDHGDWNTMGEHPDPNHYLSWVMFRDNTVDPIEVRSKFISARDFFPTVMSKFGYDYGPIPDVQSIQQAQNPDRIYYTEDGRQRFDPLNSTTAIACRFVNWNESKPGALLQVSYFKPRGEFRCLLTHLDTDGFAKNVVRLDKVDEHLKQVLIDRFRWVSELPVSSKGSDFRSKLIGGLIFSKDRALQLRATIESFLLHCTDSDNIRLTVLYKASSPLHQRQYDSLKSRFEDITFIEENDFRSQTLAVVGAFEYILFMVDDNIFTRDFSVNGVTSILGRESDAVGFSLRLGENTTYCYMAETIQRAPEFESVADSVLKYDWTKAEHDYGYPLEVSSSVYRSQEIVDFLSRRDFSNPNTLESQLALTGQFRQTRPKLLCFSTSVTFCNPVNKVQDVFPDNKAGSDEQNTVENLARLYQQGLVIDVNRYDGFTSHGVHQEVQLYFSRDSGERIRISVIIPCYNQARFLPEAVESIVNQTYTDWECIIINDGSSDNTVEVANQRTFMQRAVDIIEREEKVDIIFANMQEFGASNGEWAPHEYSQSQVMMTDTMPYASLYRKQLWRRVGGYDKLLSVIRQPEDWSFWISCSKHNPAVRRIKEKLFLYRVHPQSTYLTMIKPNRKLAWAFVATCHPDLYPPEALIDAWQSIANCPDDIYEKILMAPEKCPEYGLAYFWRGLTQRCKGRVSEAFEDYQIAVERANENDWQGLFALMMLQGNQGDLGRARSNLKKLLNIRPDLNWAKDMLSGPPDKDFGSLGKRDGKQKILFYFDRMGNQDQTSPGGTVLAVRNLAKLMQCENTDTEAHITGDLVTYSQSHDSLQFVPLPSIEKRQQFLADYDMVFFATHIRYFRGLTKHSTQIWVLYQHCWEADDPVSLAHMNDFDAVICLSELHRAFLRSQGIRAEKLVTIPNLVDTDVYSPKNVSRNNHSIMFAGGLHPHKCVHILLDAFRLVRQQVPDVQLNIYGDGAMWRGGDDYGNCLKSLKPEGVYFHGYVDNKDMPVVYSKHSILCLPSRLESFGLVTVEAQACGCIPVVHRVGGVAATLIDDQTGLLYAPNTAEKLAKTIIKAIDTVDCDSSIRQRAVDFIRENFSADRAYEYISKLLDRLNIAKQINTVKELFESGNIEQAAVECSQLLSKSLEEPDLMLLNALIMLRQGDRERCRSMLLKLLEKFGLHQMTLNNLGVLSMNEGDSSEALAYFVKAYNVNPCDKNTALNCSAAWKICGKYTEARMVLFDYLVKVGEDAQPLRLLEEINNLIAGSASAVYVISQQQKSTGDHKLGEGLTVTPCYEAGTNDPLVSVIMPAYNCGKHIGEAIESVLIQNYPKFELIIVDDGSTDDTREQVLRYDDERITYIYQENSGPSGARNRAIKQARGQYIVPLDADDMILPNCVMLHLQKFEKYPEADLVYSDVLLIDAVGNPIRVMNKPEYQDRRHLIRDLFRCGHPIVPFRLGIRRSVFDKIGFYDDQLCMPEDYDMMRRFVKAGLKAHHLGKPLHIRRMQPNSLSGAINAAKAKDHYEVMSRIVQSFDYEELFPDVDWGRIPAGRRGLHAKSLIGATYLNLGYQYLGSRQPIMSEVAFGLAHSELSSYLKENPGDRQVRQLLRRCERVRTKCENTLQQAVCWPVPGVPKCNKGHLEPNMLSR
jgi:glycosyltransferase involved in cell wall biosynthesis